MTAFSVKRLRDVLIFMLLLSSSTLVGCNTAPDENAINTAIAQTELAKPSPTNSATKEPTDTPTLAPTSTQIPTQTFTPTYTPTDTPTNTPSPTPDLRVIKLEPREFLLEKEDLPEEAKYFLPASNWISPHHNSEIISGWGRDEGREYLEKTGRIDGWWVVYYRGTQTVFAPEEIFNNVIMYESAEGAQLTVTEYNEVEWKNDEGWEYVHTDSNIGDINVAMIRKETQSNGRDRVWLEVKFAYKNYVQRVLGFGWKNEVELEYIENIARTLLAKLETAPLSEP